LPAVFDAVPGTWLQIGYKWRGASG